MNAHDDFHSPGFHSQGMYSRAVRMSSAGVRAQNYLDNSHKFVAPRDFRRKMETDDYAITDRMKEWCMKHNAPITMLMMDGTVVDNSLTLSDYLGNLELRLRNNKISYEKAVQELEQGAWKTPSRQVCDMEIWFASHDETHLMAFRLTFF